jgi:hypothetical protein
MVLQAQRKLGSGVARLHFDPKTGVQLRFNELLTDPVAGGDRARWAEVFENYRESKSSTDLADAFDKMVSVAASSAEKTAAAKARFEATRAEGARRLAGAFCAATLGLCVCHSG